MRASRIRVRLGWLAGGLALALAHPTPGSIAVGMALAVLGEALRLWASGHIEKTQALATGGPYAHSRNPLYVGSLLMAAGLAIASASPAVVVAVVVYFASFYPAVIREEAAFLRARFPDYAAWAADVPLFLPRLTPGGPRASRFAWDRVKRNKEWRTALALPVAALVLWGRTLL